MIPSLPNSLRQMGVINLTPNSFSDGKPNLNLQTLEASLRTWREVPHCVLDFGAESTAPMNSTVLAKEEWSRFETLLIPLLEAGLLKEFSAISLDTYRPETMVRLMPILSEKFSGDIIWNDVSGVVDVETLSLMEQFPRLQYILCHNWASQRKDVQKHMEFCRPLEGESFLKAQTEWFHSQLKKIPVKDHKRVLLDPCFGFAKTLEQNLFLFNSYQDFFQAFTDFIHVIGLSRKSFMRHSLFKDHPEHQSLAREALNDELDLLQKKWLEDLCQRVPMTSLMIRTHVRL